MRTTNVHLFCQINVVVLLLLTCMSSVHNILGESGWRNEVQMVMAARNESGIL